MIQYVKKSIKKILNINKKEVKPVKLNLLIEADAEFNLLYKEGNRITATPDAEPIFQFSKRWMRFYNLLQFYKQVEDIEGKTVECGCWLGLSSYILNKYNKNLAPGYNGADYIIIDSFEGLSEPTQEDLMGGHVPRKGEFNSNVEKVKSSLKEFPEIKYVKGWIPSILPSLNEEKYKFVHIDLDLYEPIKGALEYFYPRVVSGGIIVFDDYGGNLWPGAKKAVDDFCIKNHIKAISLSSGQSVVIKK